MEVVKKKKTEEEEAGQCFGEQIEASDASSSALNNGDNGGEAVGEFVASPLVPLKDQIEKDKDDESLRRWKEKLIGYVEGNLNDDFEEIPTSIPIDNVTKNTGKKTHFTLKEGSEYRIKLTFTVHNNLVSGLTYTNIVWKRGLQVDESKVMLGTFAPKRDPYEYALEEDVAPSGVLARGIYNAKLKFEDDDRRCHMELKYSFEITEKRI